MSGLAVSEGKAVVSESNFDNSNLVIQEPNNLDFYVIKRNNETEKFDQSKIERAIRKSLSASGEKNADTLSLNLSRCVCNVLSRTVVGPIRVEKIQDLVEQQLMAQGYFDVAKKYILFRDERRRKREDRPIPKEFKEKVEKNRHYFATPIQEFQFYDKYSRYIEEIGRRETWEETVSRGINFLRDAVRNNAATDLTEEEWREIEEGFLLMEAVPSMRLVQMAGPAAYRENLAIYNCSATSIDSLSKFSEILYILMQGTGVGFTVEAEYVDKLPRIRHQKKKSKIETLVVEDTTEGWCDALRAGLEAWFSGGDILFDTSKIRPQGSRLKIKGGSSSGPEPLLSLLDYTRNKILSRQGRHLSPLDCHDIVCKIGDIVQVGGVRRSALISISDLEDEEMRHAKDGQFWVHNKHRAMSNNSTAYEDKPTATEFLREWLSLADSGTGERGIFNRYAMYKNIPKRRKKRKFLGNPCNEVILRGTEGVGGGLCNLSIAVARENDTEESLLKKVKLAAYIGTIQSLLVNFNYVSSGWKDNAEEERLLGVDITGQVDCPILRPSYENRDKFLQRLKETVIETNKSLAERFGINQSVATTCIKPSGNSATLFGCSSGIHPRYARYYIRRVRVGSYTPMAKLLRDSGVPCFPEVGTSFETTSVLVFEFPVESPKNSIFRNDMTALQQLENWLSWRRNYTEHSVSCTIYVRDDEWLEVGNWVYNNWEYVSGLSFLPYDGGIYQLAPYEEITEEQYLERIENFTEIDYSKLYRYEVSDTTERSLDYACISGVCEL